MKANAILLAGVMLALSWAAAEAGGVRLGIGFNIPMGGPVYHPHYCYPPPYYYPYPYYVAPAPVYMQPAPVYVQPPAVYAQPSPVYAQPAPAYAQQPPASQQYYLPPASQTPTRAVPPAPQPMAPPSTLPGLSGP